MNTQLLSHCALADLCQQLALLLHAGVDTGSALIMMAREEDSSPLRASLEEMARQTDLGQSLSASMSQSHLFPPTLCALVAVGEQTGHLEQTLSSLAAYHSRRDELDRHLRSALLYPAILLLLMVVVIVVLLTQVLPVFNEVYAYLGGRLTGIAGGLLSFGAALNRALPALGVVLALAVIFVLSFSCSYNLRQNLSRWWRQRQGDRGISHLMNTAQFAQALSMGLSSGLPLEQSVELAASLFADMPAFQAQCDSCLEALTGGAPLSQALGQSRLLPHSECRLLELALRSGSGDQVMEQIAQRLSDQSEWALQSRLSRIEPTLVICSSLLVGLILLSVMLPLVHIMTAIG